MKQVYIRFDLIVACDTLVYHGRLDDAVAAAAAALKPGGRLLFTLERLADGGNHPYRLAPTGRFCHRAAYVQATLATVGLVDTGTDAIVPRLECGEPVDGLLVTARAPAHASYAATGHPALSKAGPDIRYHVWCHA